MAEAVRPISLAEVSRRARAREQPFDLATREFLDHFYSRPAERAAALQAEPASIGPVADAYLAAVAEHLARGHDLAVPEWAEAPGRFLASPFFAGGLEGLKPWLIADSPGAFRRRLLFVSAGALDRARARDTATWDSEAGPGV